MADLRGSLELTGASIHLKALERTKEPTSAPAKRLNNQ